METILYDKSISCPICERSFTSKKVRSRKLKIQEKHDDLHLVYKEIDPLYYQIFVCPHCGYSGSEGVFEDISVLQKRLFDEHIRYKWKSREYGETRTAEEAEACFKLAILVAQVTKKKKSYLGSLCLRLGWLYRGMKSSKEEEFLQYALTYLQDAYQSERLDEASIDELTMAYLIGELNRRFGNFKESILWFAKVLDNPLIKNNRALQLKTREQWRVAKEQYDEARKHREAL